MGKVFGMQIKTRFDGWRRIHFFAISSFGRTLEFRIVSFRVVLEEFVLPEMCLPLVLVDLGVEMELSGAFYRYQCKRTGFRKSVSS